VAGGPQVIVAVPPAPTVTFVEVFEGVEATESCMKHPVAWRLEVPELVRSMMHTSVELTQELTWALTIEVTENPEGAGVVVTVSVVVMVLAGKDPEA